MPFFAVYSDPHAATSLRLMALLRLGTDRSGLAIVEYCLIASMIASAVLGALSLAGTRLNATFETFSCDDNAISGPLAVWCRAFH